MRSLLLFLPLLAAGPSTRGAEPAADPARAAGGVTAVRAGTIHLVEDGRVLEGGATLLLRDGRVVAAGTDLEVPPGTHVVDYGPGAVVVPGFVAPSSTLALGPPSDRGADPGLDALDGFDFYAKHAHHLAAGVTSAYVTPAQDRLIAGRAAVVKLAGEDSARRVLRAPAALHGSIADEARRTPGYWRPPIPATVDVGLGMAEPQPPHSTMGAIRALTSLLAAARAGERAEGFGPYAADELAALVAAGVPWRIRAGEEYEVRSLLEFAAAEEVPLVLELITGPELSEDLVEAIAAAGVGVIVETPYRPNAPGRDLGKDPDARWPAYDVAGELARAGVSVAFSASDSSRHLRFAALVGSRGGLDAAAALRAITLTPAEMFGVAERVGSLAPGKDADLVVLNGPPLASSTGVIATWVDGEPAWSLSDARAARGDAPAVGPVVLAVEELHVGDGTVVAPAEVLMHGGRIVEVGRSVGRPPGATLVRGRAAMPGMIDALGHLGLEGTSKVPPTDYTLGRIVGPGDHVDARVADAGVTTVVLSPRKAAKTGAPMMAYKPAADDFEGLVIEDPVALRLQWTERDRLESGKDVRELLQKAVEYAKQWREYEQAIAAWTPPPPEPEKEPDEEAEAEDGESEDDEKKADEEDDKKKKKKRKKGEEEEIDPDPVTGVWTATVVLPPAVEETTLRMQLRLADGEVEGWLRCAALADRLTAVEGTYERGEEGEQRLVVGGLGDRGYFTLDGLIEDATFAGTLKAGGSEAELTAERQSREYPVAQRSERRRPPKEETKEPKGKPKEPRRDDKLEPLRRAIEDAGVAVVVEVDREDELLACVDAFEKAGIRPILYGAEDAHRVADRLRGRVAGVLLSHDVIEIRAKTGTQVRNRYAALQSAGIPVAFHSAAEEGAADLPLMAAYAVSEGMSPTGALRALTADAAGMLGIADRVGRVAPGLDADVLLLDGSPLDVRTQVLRAWVNGAEVR